MRSLSIAVVVLFLALPFAGASFSGDDDAGSGRDAGGVLGTDAVRVGAGVHAGRLSGLADTEDRYVFRVESGMRFRLTHDGAATTDVLRPDGSSLYGEPSLDYTSVGTGSDWTFLARGSDVAYAFTLRIETPQNDAGTGRDAGDDRANALPLPLGASTGNLSAVDSVDRYEIPLSKGERANVTLSGTPSGDGWGLTPAFFHVYAVESSWNDDEWPGRRTFTAQEATFLTVVVAKYGNGDYDIDYTLTLERDGGDGIPPRSPATPTVVARDVGTALLGHPEGGVEVFGDSRGVTTVTRVDANGPRASEALRASAVGGFARDAEGDLVYNRRYDGAVLREEGPTGVGQLAADMRHLAFGPDGALYGASGTRLLRLGAAGPEVVLDVGAYLRSLAFAPDGSLYALAGYDLRRIDVETGETSGFTETFSTAGAVVDAAGRIYYDAYFSHEIHRYDPATGVFQLVATGIPVVAMAFGADALYVSSYDAQGPFVARIPTDGAGFTGFSGTVELPRSGDLAITSFRQEDALSLPSAAGPLYPGVGETRSFVVEVRNEGAGFVEGPIRVVVYERESGMLFPGPRFTAEREEGLSPGESATFRFEWDTLGDFGGMAMEAYVRGGLEDDLRNNRANLGTYHVAPVSIGLLF